MLQFNQMRQMQSLANSTLVGIARTVVLTWLLFILTMTACAQNEDYHYRVAFPPSHWLGIGGSAGRSFRPSVPSVDTTLLPTVEGTLLQWLWRVNVLYHYASRQSFWASVSIGRDIGNCELEGPALSIINQSQQADTGRSIANHNISTSSMHASMWWSVIWKNYYAVSIGGGIDLLYNTHLQTQIGIVENGSTIDVSKYKDWSFSENRTQLIRSKESSQFGIGSSLSVRFDYEINMPYIHGLSDATNINISVECRLSFFGNTEFNKWRSYSASLGLSYMLPVSDQELY
jgi:hypothetical protein